LVKEWFLGEKDVVQALELLGNLIVGNNLPDDRQQALREPYGLRNLLLAVFGRDSARREDKYNRICVTNEAAEPIPHGEPSAISLRANESTS
jgi:hypothetical protein